MHSGAASATSGQRVNMTLLFSHDGKTWSDPIVLLPQTDVAGRQQTGGYSAVQGLPDGQGVGVVLQTQRPPEYHLDILFTRVAAPHLRDLPHTRRTAASKTVLKTREPPTVKFIGLTQTIRKLTQQFH